MLEDYWTLNGWGREMSECKSVDRENQRGYNNVDPSCLAFRSFELTATTQLNIAFLLLAIA